MEARSLLSVTPSGPEFQVNTYTTGSQIVPQIATDAAGDSVIAWTSSGEDGSGYGIYGQRYNPSGAAVGSEFRINSYTTSSQVDPRVAMDANGDFVVVWESQGQEAGGLNGIYAQRYNSAGVAQGTEFHVNSATTTIVILPTIAMDSTGDFVIGWSSLPEDGDGYGVYAQRYNSSGVAQGSEFQVNTFTTGHSCGPCRGDGCQRRFR